MIKTTVFDLEICNTNFEEVVGQLVKDARLLENKVLVTPNIDHYVRIQADRDLKLIYRNSELILNDSRVFGSLAKLFLNVNINTLTGSDLTKILFNSKLLVNKSIFIVGSSRSKVDYLVRTSGLNKNKFNHYQPKMNFIEDINEIKFITKLTNEIQPDFVFLALGSPQQELLSQYLKNNSKFGVALCIGASIDYLTGKEMRAPKLLQKMHLEWLFRFLQSPIKRFNRYFVNNPKIIGLLIEERRKK